MSSSDVRTSFINFLNANSSEANVLDLTGEIDEINKFLASEGVGRNDDWIGIQFIGNDEVPIGLAAGNSSGCYRETGSFFLHIVTRVRADIKARVNLLPRSEDLRNLLRGQNISGIIITGVTPPNFEQGATLEFDGGYKAATITANYYRDLSL